MSDAITFQTTKPQPVDDGEDGAPLVYVHVTATQKGAEHDVGRVYVLADVADALVARLATPAPEDVAEQRRLLLDVAYSAERLLGHEHPEEEGIQGLRHALARASELIPALGLSRLHIEEAKTDLFLARLRIKELESEDARGLLAGAIEKLARSAERCLALERALGAAGEMLDTIYTDDLDVGANMALAIANIRALLAAGALPPEVARQLSDPADLDKMDALGRLFLRNMILERDLGHALTAIRPVAYLSEILGKAYDVILSGKARNYVALDFDTVAGVRWTLVLQNPDPGAMTPAQRAAMLGRAAARWKSGARLARSRARRLRSAIAPFLETLLSPGPAHGLSPRLRGAAIDLHEFARDMMKRRK